ncbi:N-acetylmuramoyl-L-alanine amidase [Methylobrevis sp. L22]|uniref:N-acetylmuramoyl-L-alanine amidase n=2 Tax=Methylobrevis albus TaxID=2793297 RepID=A0A931I4U2_9HYPH|nr:N-acetylmuramoyl-L-alanine amidase [Methylobrevis albus]
MPGCRVALLLAAFGAALFGAGPVFAVGSGEASPDVIAKSPPVASGARVAGDADRTRFVLDLSQGVEIAAFALADPYRVVIDLPEVRFDLPRDAGVVGRGVVSGFRYGLIGRGKSRIVVDATGPVAIDRAFVLPAVEDQPARLVLDLVGTTREAFLAEQSRTSVARRALAEVEVGKGDRLPTTTNPRAKPLVVLDAGHGGIDSGTIAVSGLAEKELVLTFARDLKARLEKSGRVDVLMTRDDDSFISLGERVRIARDHRADILVSIHADSTQEDFVRGATVYTLSEQASDRDAARLAAKENSSDAIAGLDLTAESGEVGDILIDLARRETKTFSHVVARELVSELSASTRMIRNPHRSAGFQVLRAPDVPSVLLELGYLSNAQDEKLLTDGEWRDRVSDAVARAVLRFVGQKYVAGP